MSEEAEPKKKKLRKLGPKQKVWLAAIRARKELTERVNFRDLAARYNTSQSNLRVLYSDYKHGKLDLGEPESPEEAKIDARVQHERMVSILRRVKVIDLDILESLTYRAEDEMSKKKGALPTQETRNALAQATRNLKYTEELERSAQKGYISVLEELAAAHQRAQRPLQNTKEVETAVVSLSDEDRAARALGLMPDEPLPTQPPASVPEQNGSGA